jgi:hypothetical protein
MSRAASFADLFMDVARNVHLSRTHAQFPAGAQPGSHVVFPVEVT